MQNDFFFLPSAEYLWPVQRSHKVNLGPAHVFHLYGISMVSPHCFATWDMGWYKGSPQWQTPAVWGAEETTSCMWWGTSWAESHEAFLVKQFQTLLPCRATYMTLYAFSRLERHPRGHYHQKGSFPDFFFFEDGAPADTQTSSPHPLCTLTHT